MPNFGIRFVQCTKQKKTEIVQKAQMKLSMNSNTKNSQI